MNLFGKVKSIKQIEYDVIEKFGELKKGSIKKYPSNNIYYVFNPEGAKRSTEY